MAMQRESAAKTRPILRISLVLVMLPWLVGCDKGATVSGVVKFKGNPLQAGSIKFQTPDGKWARVGGIGEDGSYTFTEVPPGPMQVAVITSHLKPTASAGGGRARMPGFRGGGQAARDKPAEMKDHGPAMMQALSDSRKYVALPPRFEDFKTSGLDFEVTKGKMQHDIDLPGK